MALFFIDGIHMTKREMELNEARKRGRNAYGYYTSNPHKGVKGEEALESAWNDGWLQRADEASGHWYY